MKKNREDFLPPKEQLLTVVLDKKHRGGKVVSIIKGFSMKEDEIEVLAKKLKHFVAPAALQKTMKSLSRATTEKKYYNGF